MTFDLVFVEFKGKKERETLVLVTWESCDYYVTRGSKIKEKVGCVLNIKLAVPVFIKRLVQLELESSDRREMFR